MRQRSVALLLYLLFILLPIYWLLNMWLKTNDEILGRFTLFPQLRPSPTTSPSSPTRAGTPAISTR